jgi:hypothetical protein
MNRAAQERVQALLEDLWGKGAYVDLQPDGGVVAYLSRRDRETTIMTIADESSPLLRIIAGVELGPPEPRRPPEAEGYRPYP